MSASLVACIWLLAGVVVMRNAVSQFTIINRAPRSSPAPHMQVLSRSASSRPRTVMYAKDAADDADKPAVTITTLFMSIPYASILAIAGASVAGKVIGGFAEAFEVNPAKKGAAKGK